MSKICSVCGYNCEAAATFCPICGSPFTAQSQSVQLVQPQTAPQPQAVPQAQAVPPVQPQTAPQPQAVPPAQPQTASQPQAVPPAQPQTAPQPQAVPSVQPQTAPQPQAVQPAQPQTAPQPQAVPPAQPQTAPQPQAVQPAQPQTAPQAQFVQPNAMYTPYPQNPAMQGQPLQRNSEPPKKKNKTLWIVLGIVGGVLLLLIILAIIFAFILRNLWSTQNITRNILSVNNPATISHSDHHEYYYPDYDSASFNSERFVDITTEDPAAVNSSEEPVNPDISSGSDAGAFRAEDLIIYSVERDDTVEPLTYTIEENHSYTFGTANGFLQTGNGTFQTPTGFEEKRCSPGRGITTGASIDEFIAAYGVDTTNAIWQLYVNDTYEYYYYSTSLKPDFSTDVSLIIAWYRTGDTWQRMYPVDLFNYWQDGTLPECDALLMYIIYTDDSVNTINSMNIMYGNIDYYQQFFTSWNAIRDNFHEFETEDMNQ